MRALIVDDDATTLAFLKAVLESMGHEVTPCADAKSALEAYHAHPFPLVVVDWLMPPDQMDGLELCRAIRDHPAGGRSLVLVFTIRDHPGDLETVLDAGADDYVPKSATPDLLKIRLRIAEARLRELEARTMAEAALQESQARLRCVVNSAPLMLYAVDEHGLVTFADGPGFQALDIEPQDLLGKSISEVHRDAPEMLAHMRRALAGEEFTARFRMRGRIYSSWYGPMRLAHGSTAGALAVATDITQDHKALQEAEERLQWFADASFEGIVITEGDTILDGNRQFVAMVGSEHGDIIGRDFFEFVAEGSREAMRSTLRRPGDGPVEYEAVAKDGSTFFVEARTRPFPLEGRQARVTAIRDISNRKEAEDERRRLAEQHRQAQKLESLGVLAGGIAHDFNNLLVGVLGNASLALMDLPPDSPVCGTLEQIQNAAQRAADLTNQMLAYSGKGKFVIEPVDINALIRDMAHLLDAMVPKKARVHYQLAERPVTIAADAAQIRQVIINLVSNAADALGEGPGDITLSTGTRHVSRAYLAETYLPEDLPEGQYVLLEVTDTARGMDAPTQARMFDPFFTTKFTGRGLGLAVVLGIVRGHRGAIRVSSTPGVGTTITVVFPQVEDAVPAAQAAQPAAGGQQWLGTGTVLVVDDEETVRAVTDKLLTRLGMKVLTAKDGKEGLDTFRQHADDIDLVLLDLTMPFLNGDEVFREIRRLDPDARVILMSGYDEQEATTRFASADLSGFLQKPFAAGDLTEKLRAVFGDS